MERYSLTKKENVRFYDFNQKKINPYFVYQSNKSYVLPLSLTDNLKWFSENQVSESFLEHLLLQLNFDARYQTKWFEYTNITGDLSNSSSLRENPIIQPRPRKNIDIAIQAKDKILIVNEVKRSWNLLNNMESAREQAYNYALKVGARYVVVTNGDYYAIFDRDKGRSYDAHLEGDFKLTQLTKEKYKLTDILKKIK